MPKLFSTASSRKIFACSARHGWRPAARCEVSTPRSCSSRSSTPARADQRVSGHDEVERAPEHALELGLDLELRAAAGKGERERERGELHDAARLSCERWPVVRHYSRLHARSSLPRLPPRSRLRLAWLSRCSFSCVDRRTARVVGSARGFKIVPRDLPESAGPRRAEGACVSFWEHAAQSQELDPRHDPRWVASAMNLVKQLKNN